MSSPRAYFERLELDVLAAMCKPSKWYLLARAVSVTSFVVGMGLWG
jgi:hypothetical protein